MKKNGFNLMSLFFAAIVSVGLFSCDDDSDVNSGTGEVEIEITDAPADDAEIKSVIVTVAKVKIDGVEVDGFTAQTIDLKAYQEGNTKFLLTHELRAKTYSSLTLVLDLEKDANGNAPGCYVLTKDEVKHKLATTGDGLLDINVRKNWLVRNNIRTKLVVDFDLRKSIRYKEGDANHYTFVNRAALEKSVRLVEAEASGMIKGSFESDSEVDSDIIIAYAYKKGTFNASAETESNADGITFANAVASAEVKNTITGTSYTLAFLEEGEYELHFVAYNRSSDSGRLSFAGRLNTENEVDGNIANLVTVKAGLVLNVNSMIKI